MNKPEEPIHQRLNFLIEKLEGGVHRRFAQRLGVTSGAIGDIMGQRKSKPGFDFIGKILRAYPQLRPEWLLLGDGEMLKSAEPSKNNVVSSPPPVVELHFTPDQSDNKQVPLINYKAAANYLTGYQSQELYEELDVLSLPKALLPGKNRYTIFPVTGESMEPTFFAEDLVLCQQVPQTRWLDLRGELLCVVLSRSHGLQFKRVTVRKALRVLRCRSDNPYSLPFDLSLDDEGDSQSDVLELWAFEWLLTKRSSAPSVAMSERVANNENEIADLRYLLENLFDGKDLRRIMRERRRNKQAADDEPEGAEA